MMLIPFNKLLIYVRFYVRKFLKMTFTHLLLRFFVIDPIN